MKTRHYRFKLLLIVLALFQITCHTGTQKPKYQPGFGSGETRKSSLRFGMPSLAHFDYFQSLVTHLNRSLDSVSIQFIPCLSFDDYLDKLGNDYFDMTIVNGLVALDAENNGYEIIGKVVDKEGYKAVIITRSDSFIVEAADLKHRKIVMADQQSLATKLGLYLLHQKGLNIYRDIYPIHAPSFESAIMSVFAGQSTAGICLYRSWKHFILKNPQIASNLQVNWVSDSTPGLAILVKQRLDPLIKENLRSLLLGLHKTKEGQKALADLGFESFEEADSTYFLPLIDFQKKFNAAIK